MKKPKKSCDTERCTLCKLCLPGWKPAIAVHHKNFTYKRGELLFKEGEKLEGIFYIYEGQAKIHKKWGEDKELIVRFATEGEIVGHRGLGLDPLYPVSATALTPLTACFFPLDFFLDSIQTNHIFANDLLWFFAAELKRSERRMHQMMLLPVKNRLAQTLLKLEEKFGVDEKGFINLNVTKTDIASYSGVTYETIFRSLQELESEGLIALDAKNIRVVNALGLKALFEE
jgi:CRP/FNR family transcriptional regulator